MKVKFEYIYNIYDKEVKKNTKNKHKVYMFDRFRIENLTKIYDVLTANNYKNMKYNIFMIKSPKYRIVMSLNISDKVINHYVTRHILMPKFENRLDIRNVATRKDMGRDYAIKMVKKYLEYYKSKSECYVLKIDISKYFYSINHNVLKSMLKEKLTQEEYELVCTIIDSTNKASINNEINALKEKELRVIKERRQEVIDIPLYQTGRGLPIGNMSSQFLSIFYLSGLDHKVVHDYHLKHFCRYMDDFVIFSTDKEYLKKIKIEIEKELKEKYLLNINKKKTKIVNVKNGFVFCGYRFRLINKKTVINVSSDAKRRVKKRVKEVKYLYKRNFMSFQSVFCSINTYYNGFKFGSKKKMRRIIDKYFFG